MQGTCSLDQSFSWGLEQATISRRCRRGEVKEGFVDKGEGTRSGKEGPLSLLSGTFSTGQSCPGHPAPHSSLQGGEGRHGLGTELRTFMGCAACCKGKGGAWPLPGEESMVFSSIHTLL